MTNTVEKDFHIENGVLTSYTGRDEFIAVPEHVHTIGKEAFKACVSLKKVLLPSHLLRILSGAFKGCRKLREIEIPAGVTYVGDYAFHRCHALETISLPPSVKELGDCVFLYCDSLASVHIPGVELLGKQVFVNDVLLKELELSPNLKENCICDVFTGCSRITDISFPDGQKFVIPNAVEAVAGNMEIPALVRTIAVDILRMMELEGRCLVKFLTNLKHVEIPEGIEKIGKSCFFDKRGIISVVFPSSLKEIESRAFRNCISLEKVVFQKDQVLIHQDAFKNCSSLREICTPDQISHFIQGITGLSGESVPSLVKTIHRQVLGNFRLSGSILLKYLGTESRVIVPQGVTSIAEEAFAGNEAVDRVVLPDSLEEIGAGAFRDCVLLQTIEFPKALRRIGTGAFENCVKLLRALFPDGLVQVEDKVFKHCHGLKELRLGTYIRSIGEQAFYGCRSLKKADFPDSLASVGNMAFYRCKALKEVHLPPGTEYVGNLAFAQSGVKKACISGNGKQYGTDIFFGCSGLRVMVLEKGVRHIPDKLAYGCTALEHVSFPDTLESAGKNAWEHSPFLEHQKNSSEEGFKKNFKETSDDKNLSFVLWDGRNLKGEVSIPAHIRIIAGGAFYGNTSLTSIHFPDSITWIGPAALKGCSSLRQIIWPASITTAEAEVFSSCTSLEQVEYRNGSFSSDVPWKLIKERAFYNCRKLCRISLRYTQVVEKEAFRGCISFIPGKADLLNFVGESAFEETAAAHEVAKTSKPAGFNKIAGLHKLSELHELSELREPPQLFVIGTILVSGRLCTGEFQIPAGITAIAPFAFSGNRQITKVSLPDSLIHIGDGAFWGCSSLTDICFPSAACTVGSRAFEKCTNLSDVTLHADSVGASAFAFCISLKKAGLHGIHTLEARVFEGCSNLERCSCDSIAAIGQNCFSGCTKLAAFDFQSTEEIGSYAFQNCDSLRQITLNCSVFLRPHAFEDCGRLTTVSLLEHEKGPCPMRLSEYAFSGCTALNQVGFQGCVWELRAYRDILSETMPEIVRMIFHSAFSCFDIENEEVLQGYRGLGRIVKIPVGIRRIEAEVFRDVLMLREVSIPDTVEYIGPRAFHGTAWMKTQRSLSPMVIVRHMLLDGSCCTGDVTVPAHIRLVCGWAFAGGMGIKKIRFLSDRVRVEAYAFRNCIYLKEFGLPDGSSITFHGISDRKKELPPLAKQAVMDSLNCFKTDEHDVLTECTGNISHLLIADGITAIGDRVFQDGNLLTEVSFPSTVTAIGNGSFAGCKWLKRVRQAFQVTSIGDRAFSGCGTLEEIQLSENLSHIGARAFENCTSLKEILLPEGLEEIPDKAFFRCHSLQKVHLPSTLKRIGKEAFAFCKNMQMPSVPEGVLVKERAFTGILGTSDAKTDTEGVPQMLITGIGGEKCDTAD